MLDDGSGSVIVMVAIRTEMGILTARTFAPAASYIGPAGVTGLDAGDSLRTFVVLDAEMMTWRLQGRGMGR